MDWLTADRLAGTVGDSFYVFDPTTVAAAVTAFQRAFGPGTELLYPYKANAHPAVLDTVHRLGLGAETCSARETAIAAARGVRGTRLHAGGSGRSAGEIRAAAGAGATVIIDDPADLTALRGLSARVGLRCDFPVPGRTASRLGIAPADLADAVRAVRAEPGLRLAGVHAHYPGTGTDLFAARVAGLLAAAEQVFPETPPEFLGLGGGFAGGIADTAEHPEPTPADYADAILPAVRSRYGAQSPTIVLEPGTALVARSFRYVTRVRVVKSQPSRPTAVVAGSLLDISPNTRRTTFPVTPLRRFPAPSAGTYDIAGTTPMPDEFLAFAVPGPLTAGDFVSFDRVGAYSWGLAPDWLGAVPPVVMLDTGASVAERVQVSQ